MSSTGASRTLRLALIALIACFGALAALAVPNGHDGHDGHAQHGTAPVPNAVWIPAAVDQKELALRAGMRMLWGNRVAGEAGR